MWQVWVNAATTSHLVGLIGTLTQSIDHLVYLKIVTTINFSEPPDAISTSAHIVKDSIEKAKTSMLLPLS